MDGSGPRRDAHLKEGDTFLVADPRGDIRRGDAGEQGIYHRGTRMVSRLELLLAGEAPALLSSTVRRDNTFHAVDLADRERRVHVFRGQALWAGAFHERIRLTGYGSAPGRVELALRVGADFVDIFEVRGLARKRRGRARIHVRDPRTLVLVYEGLDGVERRATVRFSRPPDRLRTLPGEEAPTGEAIFAVTPAPRQPVELEYRVEFAPRDREHPPAETWEEAVRSLAQRRSEELAAGAAIVTSHEEFNAWVERSRADLLMLTTPTEYGPYPYAGVPWFSTVFGRDGLVSALEVLSFDPAPARGVLRCLGATQADRDDPETDAEPGKILHEMRHGEMAATGEVPYARYYGSVDATPLYVLLAGAAWRRTGDRELLAETWPHVERALAWITGPGDPDGDGLVEYRRRSPTGLRNQGWKDSDDAVFHADGRLAEGPIALVEVQGYVHAAFKEAAGLAAAVGLEDRSRELRERAVALRRVVHQRFWSEELGTFALALDGEKRPCLVRASNAGHLLWTGTASREQARRTRDTLLSPGMYSGWGVRTVDAGAARYNPMSYHDGSVWPHDTAIVARGLARYGFKREAARILADLLEVTRYSGNQRLPELFCGFPRRPGEGPTLYPVACSPQAWAAGAVFFLVEACLGLSVHAARGLVRLERPWLPDGIEVLEIRDLRVGEARVDLRVTRRGEVVGPEVLRRDGEVELQVLL